MIKENNLLEIAKEYNRVSENLLHGGYTGEFFEEQIIEIIIENLIELENLDFKLALRNMFYLGEIVNENKKLDGNT